MTIFETHHLKSENDFDGKSLSISVRSEIILISKYGTVGSLLTPANILPIAVSLV